MIFFSYSRDDSEFVVNLSKELKARGADVWLDQLDIKPGTRWDKSIEDALDASETVLVALSTTSVASNNVMDEVSYALEEGKTVIPVLLEECDVPFRLRRLQFADFSKSHDDGMQDLSSALELGSKVEAKAKVETAEPTVNEPVQVLNEPPKAEETTAPRGDRMEPAPKKSKNKFVLYAIIGVAVIIGALAIGGVFSKDRDPVDARKKLELNKNDGVTTESRNKEEPNKDIIANERITKEVVDSDEQPDLMIKDEQRNMTPIKEQEKPDLDALQKEIDALAKEINFQSTKPDPKEVEKEIKLLTQMLKKYPGIKIKVACHTAKGVKPATSLKVSEQQAELIKEMLVKYGIASNRIAAKGYGQSFPPPGKSVNRVEIFIDK